MDLSSAYTSANAARVDFQAVVTSQPHYFYSPRTHRVHEAFDIASAAGPVEVVDNVGIAPRCPVRPGDRIEVCGEMVHDRGRPPVVHWTHHDPARVHADGFIRLRGRLYA